jgi:hypothetical protein
MSDKYEVNVENTKELARSIAELLSLAGNANEEFEQIYLASVMIDRFVQSQLAAERERAEKAEDEVRVLKKYILF